MTEAKALFGDAPGEIALQLDKARGWESLGALVEGVLCTPAVEVADDAHQLRRAVERQQPLHQHRAPLGVLLSGG